jgi:hypothetical protein
MQLRSFLSKLLKVLSPEHPQRDTIGESTAAVSIISEVEEGVPAFAMVNVQARSVIVCVDVVQLRVWRVRTTCTAQM